MIDTDSVLKQVNLQALIERDLGPGKKSGRWILFSCPFPGHSHGDCHPSLSVTIDPPRYYCFACGAAGDAITWLREYHNLTFREACWHLGAADLPDTLPAAGHRVISNQPDDPPPAEWQDRARAFVAACEAELWGAKGERALDYLYCRGLVDKTIERYHLGYNPCDSYETLQDWGLPEDIDIAKVWLPRGVVIPCQIAGVMWYVNVRRPSGDPKYYKVRGSKAALFGAENLLGAELVLLCEGEFDCILADQTIGDVAGVATLGSATKRLDLATWGRYLLPARAILAALDADEAGQRGLADLQQKSAKIHPVLIPALRAGDKDITDYFKAGGDLWGWLKYTLDRLGVLSMLGLRAAKMEV